MHSAAKYPSAIIVISFRALLQLNTVEKIQVAKQLEALGVDVIEAGFPISSPGDFNSVIEISKAVTWPTICVYRTYGFVLTLQLLLLQLELILLQQPFQQKTYVNDESWLLSWLS